MSRASRKLDVGARVFTDFNKRMTEHTIIERGESPFSQSGVMFRVKPIVPGSGGGWIDADWFEPVATKET